MGTEILDEVFSVILDRKQNPRPGSYVCGLLSSGRAWEKVLEEASELVEASQKEGKREIIHEAADLIFHTLVLLAEKDVHLDEVMDELKRRRR